MDTEMSWLVGWLVGCLIDCFILQRGCCSTVTFYLITFLRQFLTDTSLLLTFTWCQPDEHPLLRALHMRTRSSDLQFSLVIFIYHECFGSAFRRLCFFYLSIHLFIQFQFSMSRSYLWLMMILIYIVTF